MKILTPDEVKDTALAAHSAFVAQFPDFDRLCVEQINQELRECAVFGWCDLSLSIPKGVLHEPLRQIPMEPLPTDVNDNEYRLRHRQNEQAHNHKNKLNGLVSLGAQRFALMVQSLTTLGFKVTAFQNPNTVFRVTWQAPQPDFTGLGLGALPREFTPGPVVTDD